MSSIHQIFRKLSNYQPLLLTDVQQQCTRISKFSYSSTRPIKSIQVCILGAETALGQQTAFLLKQNPLISAVNLQGTSRVESIAADLGCCDTRCIVRGFQGLTAVADSIRTADVILMLGLNTLPSATIGQQVMGEGPRICQLAEECAKNAPKSILIVAARPVSVIMPIVSEIYRTTDWYHPARILGSAVGVQIIANTLLAHYQSFDPQTVTVPICGGPDLDSAVPLFTQATPMGLPATVAGDLIRHLRRGGAAQSTKRKKGNAKSNVSSPFLEAVALNRQVTAIGLGLCGDDRAISSAFVRSNAVINSCRYITATVQLSRGGIVHNYGIPAMTRPELQLFEQATLLLAERERIALEFIRFNRRIANDNNDDCTKNDQPSFIVKEQDDERIEKSSIIRC